MRAASVLTRSPRAGMLVVTRITRGGMLAVTPADLDHEWIANAPLRQHWRLARPYHSMHR